MFFGGHILLARGQDAQLGCSCYIPVFDLCRVPAATKNCRRDVMMVVVGVVELRRRS